MQMETLPGMGILNAESCLAITMGCLYSYFYEIEGLDRKSWFLCQMDDVNGAQNETNAEIWKAEGTTEIPAWIEEARELWMGDNYSGLPEGCTIINEIPDGESAEE